MVNHDLDPIFIQYLQFCRQYQLLQQLYLPYINLQHLLNQQAFADVFKVEDNSKLSIQGRIEKNTETIIISGTQGEQNSIIPQDRRRTQREKRNDGNYLNKCQKDDRNLNSIVIRNFANFVNGHPKILTIVDAIIDNRKLNITAISYRDQFKNSLPPRQSYIGVGKLKDFIKKGKQSSQIKLVTLILLRKFIDADFFTVLLNSKKVSRAAKCKQLKHGRKFLKQFLRQCQ